MTDLSSLLDIVGGKAKRRPPREIIMESLISGPKSMRSLASSVGLDDGAAGLPDDAPHGAGYGSFFEALRSLFEDGSISFDGCMVVLQPEGYKFNPSMSFADVRISTHDCPECRDALRDGREVLFCSSCGSHARGSAGSKGADPAELRKLMSLSKNKKKRADKPQGSMF